MIRRSKGIANAIKRLKKKMKRGRRLRNTTRRMGRERMKITMEMSSPICLSPVIVRGVLVGSDSRTILDLKTCLRPGSIYYLLRMPTSCHPVDKT